MLTETTGNGVRAKVAVVTGGTRGIGAALAREFIARGFTVVITGRRADEAGQVARALSKEGVKVSGYPLEIGDEESVVQFAGWLKNSFGTIDVLVNNAGAHFDFANDVLAPDLAAAEMAFGTNVVGTWRITTALLPLMDRSGRGRIVNVSSDMGSLSLHYPGAPGYSLSRAALNMLTVKLADALHSERILVNAASPGHVRTAQGGPDAPLSVEEGATAVIHAALLPDDGPTGQFFRESAPAAW
ncbi:SDR family NAD(P)-dependent oxidoreductase [Paraburkholderia sp.]|uniref:SDR family NAD(P)-dependent oxidoreductase n=1 Tax=Paraburkholderia sp. TaxID=1926495 RepID=UPI003D6F0841